MIERASSVFLVCRGLYSPVVPQLFGNFAYFWNLPSSIRTFEKFVPYDGCVTAPHTQNTCIHLLTLVSILNASDFSNSSRKIYDAFCQVSRGGKIGP